MSETEQPERLQHRSPVKRAGYAIMHHVLTLDSQLSDGAFRLYALLLKYAQQKSACWPGVVRLAQDLSKTERTTARRLSELVGRGLITRERRRSASAITWIEDLEHVYLTKMSDTDLTKMSDPDMTDLSGKEEQEKKNKHEGGDGLIKEQDHTLELLTDFGIARTVARKLARKCEPSQVEGWIAYASGARNLRDPVGLVVRRLLDGEPVPAESESGGDGRDRRTSQRDRERYKQWGKTQTKTCPVCFLVKPIEHICQECGRCWDCCSCEEIEEVAHE